MSGSWEYEQAYTKLLQKVRSGFCAHDPVLAGMTFFETQHSGPSRSVSGPNPLMHPMSNICFEAKSDRESWLRLHVPTHTEFLSELGFSFTGALKTDLFKNIDEIDAHYYPQTDLMRELDESEEAIIGEFRKASNRLDVTVERAEVYGRFAVMLLRRMRHMEILFEPDGTPILPIMVVHPDFSELGQFEDVANMKQRVDEIVQIKKEEWIAKRNSRRLSK